MTTRFLRHTLAAGGLALLSLPSMTFAQESGAQLAAGLRGKEQGASSIRARMQLAGNQVLQLQIKTRVSDATSDIVYQILFPKERKGEAVLLHRAGDKFSGTTFTLPDSVKPIGQMTQPLFGSALTCEDIIDSPFAWPQQTIVGTETIGKIECQILESRPGKHSSSYASVKTWADPRRLVPLRIEKYDSSGKVVRRINVTRVLLDGSDSLPADLSVDGSRGATAITGAGIKRNVTFNGAEFTPDGLKPTTPPPNSQQPNRSP